MNILHKTLFIGCSLLLLAACGGSPKTPLRNKAGQTARKVQPVRITHIDREQGAQELMLHSIDLIGTPYRYGGSTTAAGFDCSGMVQFVYKNALNVNLPRTARDMAAASRPIPQGRLKTGDLVFFNTGGLSKYSHVGMYIGNGEFIHAPSSRGVIRTEKLDSPYYSKRFIGAHTFF
ncbi:MULTISPECIES: C40 family peptidase [unclassified Neisseria]|uniref:C40 family peptidase n=1 Tax=unclassified Neisseria TaxID=2623750 RepID=UPI002666668E|nr:MULTISPECIES: C40 family peptidase [unclassified Neisseria]MDO1510361.1 C40 family peptidase [Neisseria sp. MVDL19-042950]MDO1516530.1 C40 family peptidase [Neisseria sp. MVDL18-041461]MDO1563677.1 C40 family peptidase [Neisseria sp. MVDL20-010259]